MHLGATESDFTPDLPPGHGCDDVVYVPEFLRECEASRLLEVLRSDIPWQEESICLYGRRMRVPRLVAWAGDSGVGYRYSGIDHVASGWPASLNRVAQRVADSVGRTFNFVLLNRYRTGADHMGWHSDDEPALGESPVIASISLGAIRRFRMRRRADGYALDLPLEHGSLLVMRGACQRLWQHALARTRRPVGERINLTFRQIQKS